MDARRAPLAEASPNSPRKPDRKDRGTKRRADAMTGGDSAPEAPADTPAKAKAARATGPAELTDRPEPKAALLSLAASPVEAPDSGTLAYQQPAAGDEPKPKVESL